MDRRPIKSMVFRNYSVWDATILMKFIFVVQVDAVKIIALILKEPTVHEPHYPGA